jgi:hypothetical protein
MIVSISLFFMITPLIVVDNANTYASTMPSHYEYFSITITDKLT